MDHQTKHAAEVGVGSSVCVLSRKSYLDNEHKFLVSLFQRLSGSEVAYCVLRNYQSLPNCTDGSDIDILLKSGHEQRFIDILRLTAQEHSANQLVFYRSGSFIRVCYCNPSFLNGWGIQFDLHTDETYRGLPFFDKQRLLKNIIYHNNIPVLNSGDAIILALLKECLSNLKTRKHYHESARKVYADDPDRYSNGFRKYFGEVVADDWDDYLLQRGAVLGLRELSKKSRRALFITTMRSTPFCLFTNKLKYHFDRVVRIVRPVGYSVAILGADGSGKTTIINNITPLLELALHSKLNHEHMRPNLLPSLAELFGKKQKQGIVANPHGSKPSGIIGSILRLLYYTVDYIFGYWFKVYPQMVRKPCLFVFDRYFYDYLIDQRRARISVPSIFVRFISKFVPNPGVIICLGADPGVIHKRKPELSLEETTRQVAVLKEFCKEQHNAVWIDTSVSIGESSDEVLRVITDRMASRYMRMVDDG